MLEENCMAALIIRIPDGKRERLKDLARARKQSMTKLFDEMATVLLAEYDAETRFHARGGRGAVLAESVAHYKNHKQDDRYESDGLRRSHGYLSLRSSLPPPFESVSALLHVPRRACAKTGTDHDFPRYYAFQTGSIHPRRGL